MFSASKASKEVFRKWSLIEGISNGKLLLRSFSHLSQLLDTDLAISITVKQGKGLLQAVDVAGSDLPVRADPEGGGPRHGQEVIRFGRRKA